MRITISRTTPKGRKDQQTFDPGLVVKKCMNIYARHGRNHDECPHCPALQRETERQVNEELLKGTLQPEIPPATLERVVEFNEMAKPWGQPCGGPADTQPYVPVKPDPTGFAIEGEDDD